jgi:ElaB/YqjD/DUF883 family membrane-anchored ribosome-binding protein
LAAKRYIRVMNRQEMTDKIQDMKSRASDVAKNVGQQAHEYVHENAWASVACAALLGCVVGFLLARRD